MGRNVVKVVFWRDGKFMDTYTRGKLKPPFPRVT